MPSSFAPTLAGFAFGLSFIVAIGAQNAFVLRQGIARTHVFAVVAVCALSDLILVGAGVAGAGYAIDRVPGLVRFAYWGGALFLLVYGALSARRAYRMSSLTLDGGTTATRMGPAVLTAFALTWLNPHVYLDTVVLLGSVAATYDTARVWFGVGAGAASIAWFTALGYGAQLLRPAFAKPVAWRVLDGAIAVFMLILGAGLAVKAINS
ncbi:MAG: LysE/ArgO family amino acid transporter [Rhodococcus sp. (in: high G+C Gram-positive bacteria)]